MDVTPSPLRRLRIYGGARGIWVDKPRTCALTSDGHGVAVAVLHADAGYGDELSEGGIAYRYPSTEAPGWDHAQVAAMKSASKLRLPIFVITHSSHDPSLRRVRLGLVENCDDRAGQFILKFRHRERLEYDDERDMNRIVYVDMDGVLVDFLSAKPRVPAALWEAYEGRGCLDDIPGVFALMDPMPHAIESYRELAGLFDTYILSTAPWANPSSWSDKLLWVRRHLDEVAHKRLILSHHKDLARGDFLIDDRPQKRGAATFQGELVHFGSERFPDWPAVMAYLRGKA